MKRRRKEHLAGISVRKFVGQKKSAIIKRTLKDKTLLNPKGKMGKEFIAYLRRVQCKYHFDLVVINPLRGVSGIDLAKNSELTEFCRGGMSLA